VIRRAALRWSIAAVAAFGLAFFAVLQMIDRRTERIAPVPPAQPSPSAPVERTARLEPPAPPVTTPAIALPVPAEPPAPPLVLPPLPTLGQQLATKRLRLGAPVFIRIFKETHELEVWIARGGRYERFKTYEICAYSGGLGPKLAEGDHQSPEGIYDVGASQLHPKSRYHLAFNLGFPNALDRAHGRTGSFLMVYGDCLSVGCYAMSNHGIGEIYRLVEAAVLRGESKVPVHIFPFRMTDEAMARHAGAPWQSFWADLKPAYDSFEVRRVPPAVIVRDGRYALAR
jgi:murein L,D-transpeptidase YafK